MTPWCWPDSASTGATGLQELIEQPVVEICEASAHVAMMIGRAYSVVTTLQRSVPAIEDRLRLGRPVGPVRVGARERHEHAGGR